MLHERLGGVRRRIEHGCAGAIAALLLLGCSTATDYKPVWRGNTPVGYSERQVALNRFQVSFSGSSTTSPEEVERNLMRRAAEVTLQSGYNHFMIERRDTQRNRYRIPSFVPDTYLHGPDYAERVRVWSNYPEVWEGIETRSTAQAEIHMLKPEEVAANPGAIVALSVLLGPPPPVSVASAAQ